MLAGARSSIYALIRSNPPHRLRWFITVLAGFIVLSLLIPAKGSQHAVLLLLLVLAAVLPWALLSTPVSEKQLVVATAKPIAVGSNILFLYFSQVWFGTYNNLLVFGVWLMVTLFYFALLYRSRRRQLTRIRWLLNALITLALLLAIPDVNGVHMTMLRVPQPTKVGVYPIDSDDASRSERFQHFQHVDDARIDDPVKFKLHSPVAGNAADAVRVLLKPIFPAEFKILSLSLVNYLGYDARMVERFDSNRIRQVENIGGSPTPLSFDNTRLSIDRIRGHVWLKVPIDTPPETRSASPARRNNLGRAVLYWQIIWLLNIILAPTRLLMNEEKSL